ncbi:TetR/AcrR family transcriptional regulator [Crossiella cryophila]|uniref:AcrR family transcriptional regulator n=1 Tax=Crossiella cryophila TaxID=43355 RepID=A0A7W7FY40_9PSEU|nr:TetR/AcrR family transcriptional regulator [Crossiella cryophila]MBB4679659.1 AcrR family transcriptional regulator [Crossiella cryophila]
MSKPSQPEQVPARSKRADALRNQKTLLAAAAAVFITSGVDAPIREIAARAGVGMGTIYRNYPTRAELVIAVYRHQIEALVDASGDLQHSASSPFEALRLWVDRFVDFLVTKHGLADIMQPNSGHEALHSFFLDWLVPACENLLDAAEASGEIKPGIEGYELMRGIGNLCVGRDDSPLYDPRRMIELLLQGLRHQR